MWNPPVYLIVPKSKEHTYIAIDLKSFYASVECVDRGLDPLTTNLVVADASRTEKTICLAVTPSLKSYGISGRARLFELVQRVREVNEERLRKSNWRFCGKSYNALELKRHPDWSLDYIIAPPRMSHYIKRSTDVYTTYLKYIAPEDIHVYSIDEVIMDVSPYLKSYNMSAHQLAMTMIRDVLRSTGITATAGIGSNMYLAKVAMDIVAKHSEADSDGVRIGELDEMSYRRKLWNHKPLTSFWRVGRGIAERLAPYGIDTMGKIARISLENEDLLYKLFGVNAELLIDHSWGWEPCTIDKVKAYRPENNSFSSGQVLTEPYTKSKAHVVLKEMAEMMALKLVEKKLLTNQLVLTVNYDRESLTLPEIRKKYNGPITKDYYGRAVPKHAHGTANLKDYSSSAKEIINALTDLYERIVNADLLIRRLNLTVSHVIDEDKAFKRREPLQLSLFDDIDDNNNKSGLNKADEEKERKIQEAQIAIKERFGNNAILKGINFEEGATAIERNAQIGGHKA